MKALVLSGGTGTRLRPFTHSMPKQLIPVANRPILHYCLDNIREAGITEIGMIVGLNAEQIMDALGDGAELGVHISYIHQAAPLGLAHCVRIARDFLGDDDFLMYLGDNLLIGGIEAAAEDFRQHRPAAQILVAKVPDPRQFGVVERDVNGRVVHLAEKPENPRSDLAIMGVYFFTPQVHEAVEAIRPSARGELEITDAVQWLLTEDHGVRAFDYDGYWNDAGTPEAWLGCNRAVLDEIRGSVSGSVDEASELVGNVIVEDGATVIRSRVVGPAVIAAGAVVRDSAIGPYTAVGAGCLVASSDLSDSVLLESAQLHEARGVRGSVLGRRARIVGKRDRHAVLVGDDVRLEIGD
ncbi:glucose-1-phosphate thymidylyltransferase [Kitasatospora sp. NBC_01302]|uniref:glucose-1-phosphate thymidylyltransferase n=1 Tax=Kitasatospora sp. NBC_01302 TaxID=2903575 RepID=UPI002E0E385E|nr:glucose-1-phosphate thymidylyltransferase [Kitasatospora sp. NBC_01302]